MLIEKDTHTEIVIILYVRKLVNLQSACRAVQRYVLGPNCCIACSGNISFSLQSKTVWRHPCNFPSNALLMNRGQLRSAYSAEQKLLSLNVLTRVLMMHS